MGVELIARMHTLKKMRAVDGHQAAGDVADVIRRTYSTVELLITHSLIWEFKGLFNSKFPNSIMHYEQFNCRCRC